MAKPSILRILPFDAEAEYIVQMNYTGNLPYSNKITIYDAATLEVIPNPTDEIDYVYTDTVQSHIFRHTIPAKTLVNGKKYAIDCQMFDSNGTPSAISDKVYFYCFKKPVFEFINLKDEGVVQNSIITLDIKYSQTNWEDLYNYRFHLYNDTYTLLTQSDILYDIANPTYTFNGLENKTTYYARATGTTKNGIELDTGYIQFFTDFKNPNSYARLYTEVTDDSVVHGYTNVTLIEPTTPKPNEFTFNNGWIDLREKTLTYAEEFVISGDFTMTIRIRNANKNCDILRCNNDTKGFRLSSYLYDDGTRYKLTVPGVFGDYILYSDPIKEINYNDESCIHIRRINNIYLLKVWMNGAADESYNMWIGYSRPLSNVENYDVWVDLDKNTIRIDKNDVTIYYQNNEPANTVENNIWIGGNS